MVCSSGLGVEWMSVKKKKITIQRFLINYRLKYPIKKIYSHIHFKRNHQNSALISVYITFSIQHLGNVKMLLSNFKRKIQVVQIIVLFRSSMKMRCNITKKGAL